MFYYESWQFNKLDCFFSFAHSRGVDVILKPLQTGNEYPVDIVRVLVVLTVEVNPKKERKKS